MIHGSLSLPKLPKLIAIFIDAIMLLMLMFMLSRLMLTTPGLPLAPLAPLAHCVKGRVAHGTSMAIMACKRDANNNATDYNIVVLIVLQCCSDNLTMTHCTIEVINEVLRCAVVNHLVVPH